MAAEAPDDAPAVAAPIAPETDEYEEEHDEELFGIFLEQLQEGLEALQSWTDALPGAEHGDRIELLGRCLGQIDPLRSSANYMGYGKLTTLYDGWNEALQTARKGLDRGDDHDMAAFIADEMQPRIEQIKATFPRLTIADPAPHGLPAPSNDDPYGFIETEPDDFTDGAIRGDSDADSFLENMDMAVPSPVGDDRPPAELNLFPQGHVEDEDAPPASTNENTLDLPLLQDFISETVEHLEEMEGNLLQLETDPGNRDTLNDIFRSVHTIKGAAEYLGMERIAELSHKLENLLDLMRHNAQTASREVIDLLMAARDRIGILTADLHQTQAEQADIDDLLVRIQALDHETAPPPDDAPAAPEGDPATMAAEAPDDAPAVAAPIAPETDEYEEEHDEELFGIFLEQLQEGLEALQSWTDALPGAEHGDRIELLGRCLGQIDPLRSSANYMGYRKLTALYDRWNEAIQTARERLGNAEDHFLPAFIAGCMQATIDDISRCFPRLEHPAAASHAMADEGARPDIQTAAEATALAPPDLLDAYAEAPDIVPDQDSDPAPAVPLAEGDDLFDRLSRSFDHRMAEHQAPAPDTFSSGMAFELFSEDPPQSERDHGTAPPTTDDGDVEDPLTAYVDAPETPAAESPTKDQAEALESPSPAGDAPIDPTLSTDLFGEKTSGEIPVMAPEESWTPADRPVQEPEPIPEKPIEDPDTAAPPSDDSHTTIPPVPSEPSDTDTPPAAPVSDENPPGRT